MLGGTFFGVAGGIYAYYVTFLNVGAVFDIVTSMLIVLAALLGGRGTLWGPVLGAFIIEPLANLTSTSLGGADAGAIRLLLFGGLLGGVVLFLPRGRAADVRAPGGGKIMIIPNVRWFLRPPTSRRGRRPPQGAEGAGASRGRPAPGTAPCSRSAAWRRRSAGSARSTAWTWTSPRPALPA